MPVFAAKGTRDFLPAQMRQRLAVIQIIREVYASFGFEPLDTPAMERVETLTGKYGEEGDRLIFKILERGEGGREGKADLALRYDLTVPLARVMAMNQGLPLPFKRYQIAPVWRADRPQKGRFREFYQCDGDIVGTSSLLADAECIAMANQALERLGFTEFEILVNHRGWLSALVESAGVADREVEVLVELDKLDKIGPDAVKEELIERGIPNEAVQLLWARMDDVRRNMRHVWSGVSGVSEAGEPGAGFVTELATLFRHLKALGVPSDRIKFEPSLARGLGYYTGSIYEIKLREGGVGTVAAGGRYDKLIGMFSGKTVPAVGISIGLERLLVVMEELGRTVGTASPVNVLVTVFSDETSAASLELATDLRRAGTTTEVWLGRTGELGKQLKYASQRGVPYAAVLGPDEIAQGTVTLKDLGSRTEERLDRAELVRRLTMH